MQMGINHTLARFHNVYLDGEELKGCIFADEEAGYADCYKVDSEESGKLTVSALKLAHNEPMIERKRGKVQIVYVGEASYEPPTRTPTGYRDSPSDRVEGTGFATEKCRSWMAGY